MKTVFNSSEKQNTDTNRSRVRVGANRACVDALEKGRFLPSIALAYNIAAALEIYVYEVSHPMAQLRARCRNRPGPAISSIPQPRVSPHSNREA